MSAQINGYLCRNCADVALAKRGIDPAHPRQEEEARRARATAPTQLGQNQPAPAGSAVGGRLNMYA